MPVAGQSEPSSAKQKAQEGRDVANPLDILFPNAVRDHLKKQGWRVVPMGGDWIIYTPNGQAFGKDARHTSLFATEDLAWEFIPKYIRANRRRKAQ